MDFKKLAADLFPAVHQAGGAIMKHFHAGVSVEYKPDASPVTSADRDSEDIILAALRDVAPDVPVISEEAFAENPVSTSEARFFLVDPLDGTKEFINQNTDFTVNIGLIDDGVPRFGVIYAPAHGDIYMTLSAADAVSAKIDVQTPTPEFSSLQLERLQTRKPETDNLRAVVSRSHLDSGTRKFLDDHQITDTSDAGSSLKFCLLARGEADVYPRLAPTMEWDTAAGDAILRASGGVVMEQSGDQLRYGKREARFLNPSFIAWADPEFNRN